MCASKKHFLLRIKDFSYHVAYIYPPILKNALGDKVLCMFLILRYCVVLCAIALTLTVISGVYPLFDQSFRWAVFKLINDITNYQYDNLYARSLYPSFNYEYFYSVKSIFLRHSKAVENRRKAQWVLALM